VLTIANTTQGYSYHQDVDIN